MKATKVVVSEALATEVLRQERHLILTDLQCTDTELDSSRTRLYWFYCSDQIYPKGFARSRC